MKVCHILFSFIFLTQEDGNSGRVSAETSIHRVEGEDVTFECSFVISGSTKFFYKGDCENGNIVIRTTDDTFQSGRYSMKYVRKGFWTSDIMSVSITQLKTSDSGRYCCTLDETWSPDYFKLIVTEASNTLTPDFTLKSVPATTTQSLTFSLGGSTPSSASTELIKHSETPAGLDFFLLLVVVSAVVLVLMFLVVLTLIYRKRTKGSVVLDRRRNSDYNQTETALYEFISPARTCEESIYQSLDAGSRDQDQTYSTLPHTK